MDNYLPECHILCIYCGRTMDIDDVDKTKDITTVYHLCECGACAIEKRRNKKCIQVVWEKE